MANQLVARVSEAEIKSAVLGHRTCAGPFPEHQKVQAAAIGDRL
jgi:hypothetical protein